MSTVKSSVVALFAVVASAGFVHEASAVPCTWSGASSASWSDAGNWSCAGGPSTGDDLEFPNGAANLAMNQNVADLSVNSLTFSGNGGGYSLTGTGNLTISGGSAITSTAVSPNKNTLALTNPLKFGAALAVVNTTTGAGGRLDLNGPIDLNGSELRFVWDATVPQTFVNGIIAGSGALSVNGIGGNQGLFLAGDNTFAGPVTVNGGYLVVNHVHALGAGGSLADGTTVGAGATLVLNVDTANEYLTLAAGSGTSGNGNVQANGVRVWGGPVVLGSVNSSTTEFNLLGSQVTFSGPVTGTGGFSCCNAADGKIALSNSGSTYSGPSDFNLNAGGTLKLLANNALSPNSAVSLGGATGGVLDMGAFSGTAASFAGSAGSTLNITAGQTLAVSGAVNLNNTILNLSVPGSPGIGTVFKILDKNGGGAISGTFNGLPEGSVVSVGLFDLTISYVGGDGNDVALTVNSTGISSVLAIAKAGTGTGTVTSNVGAINCGPTCSDTLPDGTVITLNATPSVGSQFTGWLGPCTGVGTCHFTIDGATTATATFALAPVGAQILDIDGDGTYDALTDGLMVIRYLSGLTGTSVTADAVTPGAPRSDPSAIMTYLGEVKPLLDIDGNGVADASTDGLLIIRYMFGLRGAGLIADAVGTGAIRATAPDIEAQLLSLMP